MVPLWGFLLQSFTAAIPFCSRSVLEYEVNSLKF